MDKIILFFLLLLSEIFSGCQEPKEDHFFVINHTTVPITIQSKFRVESGEQVLKATIQPAGSEGWAYTVPYVGERYIDKNLLEITVLKKECLLVLSRDDIEKKATRNGAWRLSIKDDMFSCP